MKSSSNKFTITLKLEDGFVKNVRREIEKEIDISEKKWGVNLNSEDRSGIITHTFNQLFKKVFEITKVQWSGSDTIVVKIATSKTMQNINLSKDSKVRANVTLVKLRDGWSVTSEDLDENVPVNEFYDHFVSKVIEWARTAAFYGVGSYN